MQPDASPTVFLVDDSPLIRDRLRELLELAGAVGIVGEAATVASAIERIQVLNPEFVVLDYGLPDGTGLDVLRALGSAMAGTTFIVLTNHANDQLRDMCLRAGARYFLDKSTEFERLPVILATAKPKADISTPASAS